MPEDVPEIARRIADLAKADAGHTILAVAITDEMLETLILSYLPKISDDAAVMLFSYPGPLNALVAKAKFAFALGLIEMETFKDLKGIQKVRNAFAHPRGFMRFDSPEVAAVFREIKHWPSGGDRKALFDARVACCCKAMKGRIDQQIWKHAIEDNH